MKNKYCENCGSKLSESAKFCGNCGVSVKGLSQESDAQSKVKVQVTANPSEQKKESNTEPKKTWKKKLKNGIIAGVTVAALLWAFDTFTQPDYPATKNEFAKLYCEKCWHLSSVKIEELYLNGTSIPVGETERDSLTEELVNGITDTYQQSINDEGEFEIAKLASDGELIVYSQYYDDSFGEYVFNTNIPKFNISDDKFNFVVDGTQYIYSVESGDRLDTDYSSQVVSSTVDNITENKLELIAQYEYSDEYDVKLVMRMNYTPITPKGQHRYESEFAMWDQPK